MILIDKEELIDLLSAWHRVMELDGDDSYTKFYDMARKEVEENYVEN